MSVIMDRAHEILPEKVAAEIAKRAARAIAEAGNYDLWRFDENTIFATNLTSHETYEIEKREGRVTCTCPDFRERGEVVGPCKHIRIAAARKREIKPLPPCPEPKSAPKAAEPTPAQRLSRLDRIDFNSGRWLGDQDYNA